MNNRLKKTLFLMMTMVLICSSLFSVPSYAATTKNGPNVDVSVYQETGDNGIVTVDISLSKNPGVGAFTFTLLYDYTAFGTTKYYSNRYFYYVEDEFIYDNGYSITDFPEHGMVKFVWHSDPPIGMGIEPSLYTGTGVMFRLKFLVKSNVSAKYPFEIGNINPITYGKDLSGCFADFEHNVFNAVANNDAFVIGNNTNISPTYPWIKHEGGDNPGSDITPSTHNHNYVLYRTVDPSCLSEGYSIYECTICSDKQKKDIKSASGHAFDDFWTVDRPSTDSVAMKLSRHCSRCNTVKDVYYFSSQQVKDYALNNTYGAKIKIGGETAIKIGIKSTADNDTSTIEKTNNQDKDYSKNKNNVENAEELIESAKEDALKNEKGTSGKVKRAYSLFSKIYKYLIGTREKPGVLAIIFKAIIKWFK